MTEGQGVRCAAQSGHRGRPPRREFAELLSRTGRSTKCASWSIRFPKSYSRARLRGAHRDRHERAGAPPKAPSKTSCASFGRDYHATQAANPWVSDLDGGRCGRAMVGGRELRAPASSTAPSIGLSASPGLVVQAVWSTPPRCSTASSRPRSWSTDRSCIGNWLSAELRTLLFRRGDADPGDHPLDQTSCR